MSKTEERLRNVLNEMNSKHKQKIDQQIYGIFLFGFMMGVIFSYTNLLGYSAGFVTGIIACNNFPTKALDRIEDLNHIFSNVLNKIKIMLYADNKNKVIQ